MKEICILNRGDNVNKINFALGLKGDLKESRDKILGYRYVRISEGGDDIVCVRNYQPYFIRKIDENNTLLDIYASGFGVVGGDNGITLSDDVVVKKLDGLRYTVSPMEKIEDIAFKLGVTKQEIMEKNGLLTEKLFVGQVLIV